ncbi:hypothetical protein BBJ28_00022135 [Nothophytophthora sp. Chile5]|nr:hypothetical protein BBJ28_00022135 [Nothophytophthora sp. Chile5]
MVHRYRILKGLPPDTWQLEAAAMASPMATTTTTAGVPAASRAPRPLDEEIETSDREIPIRITLGAATLRRAQQPKERARELEARNAELEAENAQLKDNLDEERSRSQAEQEKSRAASMKTDVVALLEQARVEGVDVRKLSTALTAGALAAVNPLPNAP